MAVRLILKNSSVEDKRPTSSQLDQGEISLNTNAAGPFLCCEDSEGNIQQIGGVKISDDAPGTPVRGTFWLNTVNEKFYIFDGQNWRAVAGSGGGGGGGGGGIDTVIGGDGIDASQLGEIVTIDNDIDRNRGLEFVAGRTAVALGSGLSFDADGKIAAESTAMTYKGTVNLTAASVPGTPDVGDSYANVGSGNFSAEWLAATGETDPTTANPGDLVIWNGTQWTYVPTGSGGGGGGALPTDLSIGAHDANELEIDSSTGTDVVLPLVDEAADKCGLMSPDDKTKLDTVEDGAQANVNADWDADSGDAEILNKPAIPAAQVNSDWDATSGVAEILNKPDLGVTQITAGTNIAIDPVAGTGNVTINVEDIVTEIVAGDNVTIDPADGLGAVTVNADVGEAPNDGKQYARQSESWSEVIGGGSGGVNQIVAGDNITIDPSDGLGTVTINSTGGGTGAGVSSIIAGDGISVDQATGDVTITNTGGGGGGGGTTKADIYGTAKLRFTFDGSTNSISQGSGASVSKTGTGTYEFTFDTPITSDYYISFGGGNALTAFNNKTSTGFRMVTRTPDNGSISNTTATIDIEIFDDEPAEIIVGTGTVANTNIYGTAKLWGTVNATGGVTSGSGGYTVVQNSPGNYSLTFNTPQPSAAYTVVAESDYQPNSLVTAVTISNKTTNGFNVFTNSNSDGGSNSTDWNFSLFNDTPAEVALTTFGDVINYSGAAAWGNVAGDGALNGGLNIASVTKQETGKYLVTLSTPMPDENYAVTSAGESTNNFVAINSLTTTSFVVFVKDKTNAFVDNQFYFNVHALNALPPKGGTGTDCWATVKQTTSNGLCDVAGSFNVASVTRTAKGNYDVVFTTPMPSRDYAVNLTPNYDAVELHLRCAAYANKTSTGFSIWVKQTTNGEFQDNGFSFTVNATNAKLPNSFTEEELQTIIDLAQSGVTNPGASAWGKIDENNILLGGNNIASVVTNSDGEREITFQTPMPDDNYSVVTNVNKPFKVKGSTYISVSYNHTSTGFTLRTKGVDSFNEMEVSFVVFATNALPPKGGTGTDCWATVDKTETNGPCAFPASFNVKSVTRAAKGKYDVVFTTPMPTANYSIQGSASNLDANTAGRVFAWNDRTTTGFRVKIKATTDSAVDDGFSFAVNATNATLPSTITQEEADLIIDTIKGGGVAQKVAVLADVKPAGTEGGTNISGWQDRTLNTIQSDTGDLVTLANDKEFTLKAGTYLIEWSAPSYRTQQNQSKLINVTTGSIEQMGSSEYSWTDDSNTTQSRSFGSVRINIASDTTYKIQTYCNQIKDGNGLGARANSGEDEIYTQVTITDLAVLAAGGGSGGGGGSATVGEIVAWASPNVPTGWLECDGSPIPSQYSSLIALVGANTPDLRGEFVRGWDNGAGVDAGRALLTNQADEFKSHQHRMPYGAGNTNTTVAAPASSRNNSQPGPKIQAEGGSETRPRNVALMYIIHADGSGGGGGGDTFINYSGAAAWGYIDENGDLASGLNCTVVKTGKSGERQVTFDTPMPNANYSVTTGVEFEWTSADSTAIVSTYNKTENGFTIRPKKGAIYHDSLPTSFAVHALNALPPKGGTGTDAWGSVDKTTSNGPCNVPASFNVASVTRSSQGKYDVVFTTPMPTSEYAVTLGVSDPGIVKTGTRLAILEGKTTTGFSVCTKGQSDYADFGFDFTVNATNAQLPDTVTQEQIEAAINNPGASAWGYLDKEGKLANGMNIGSVAVGGTGERTITFQTPMPDANYSVVVDMNKEFSSVTVKHGCTAYNKTATGFTIRSKIDSSFANQPVSFIVFATNALPPKGGTGTDAFVNTVANDGTIGSSFNIASVSKQSTGTYEVLFTTPMPDDKYCVTCGGQAPSTRVFSQTAAGFTVQCRNLPSGDLNDNTFAASVNATNATLPTSFTAEQIQSILDVIDGGLGVGVPSQSWQDVKSSRTTDTAYTNDTGNAIQVQVSPVAGGSLIGAFLVDGVEIAIAQATPAGGGGSVGFSVIVPNGSTYQVNNVGNYIISHWFELRA